MMDRAGSVRKQTKDALARITDLEEQLPQIVQGVNSGLGQANNQISQLQELVEALTEVIGGLAGADAVPKAVVDLRAKHLAERIESEKAMLEAGVKNGDWVTVDAVTTKSLIVGTEADKDGAVLNGGRIQILAANLKPEFKEKLLGQKVGGGMDLPTGGKFTVTEIYDSVVKPPPAPAAAAPVAPPAPDTTVAPAGPEVEAAVPEAPGCDGNCGDCPLAKKADCDLPEKKA